VTDILIEGNIVRSSNIDKEVTMNMYLQTWSSITNVTSTLPPDIKRMLNTKKKYNLCLDALRILEDVKKLLPAWYCLGVENNSTDFNWA